MKDGLISYGAVFKQAYGVLTFQSILPPLATVRGKEVAKVFNKRQGNRDNLSLKSRLSISLE